MLLLEDIAVCVESGRLRFGNAKLTLELDAATGCWLALRAAGIPGSLITPARAGTGAGAGGLEQPGPVVDFCIDGKWMVEAEGADLLCYDVALDRCSHSATLSLVCGAGEYELTCTYTLYPGQSRLDRAARLTRLSGAHGVVHLEGFRFTLPGVALGEIGACTVDAPGPWFTHTYVPPGAAYKQLSASRIKFHSAPDCGFGLLAVGNRSLNATLAAWMDTGGQAGYVPALCGASGRLSFGFCNGRAYRMPAGFAALSDVQTLVLVQGPLSAALAEYRGMAARTMPLETQTPAWVRDMVLLEILPTYFPAGLPEITARLPFYRDIGINALYLMPHWPGGYNPIDPFAVDPAVGTPDDLRAFVGTAHDLGMRVLFDMVIHGFSEKTPLLAERPELFARDETGQIARHPVWKSMSTDWASPAYQDYLCDLVRHDLREYDIDGCRVDAASFKGPNWDPTSPYPAHRSATAAPALLRRVLQAMRAVKPDAVLLSEVCGPVFYSVCNLAHDNQTEAVQQFLEMLEEGQATAADYKAHLANVFDLLPAGAHRVFFGRNHDTSWFYRFHGYTRRFLAIEAIHALCAIPEIFAGDKNHGPNPDDDPAVFAFYRKLFARRRAWPELTRGALDLRGVECNNPMVFTALRHLDGQSTLLVVSLSGKLETATVTLPGGVPVPALSDLRSDAAVPGGALLQLQPFQVLVGRL